MNVCFVEQTILINHKYPCDIINSSPYWITNHIINEYYHIKQHKSKPPSYTVINCIIYKLKSIYIYKYILCKNVHIATSDQRLDASPHIFVKICLFLSRLRKIYFTSWICATCSGWIPRSDADYFRGVQLRSWSGQLILLFVVALVTIYWLYIYFVDYQSRPGRRMNYNGTISIYSLPYQRL